MRVGLRITPDGTSAAARLAELPAFAAAAEEAGFELLVVPERLSATGGFPAALPACAAAAAATARLRVATGLLALPLHHPLRVAEDAATLDALSGGRFELGVGLGAEVELFGGFGLDVRERAARFEEALEVVRRGWGAGPVHFIGRHFRCEGVDVQPKPVQPGGPPLWLGARGADALARAAQLGCGVVLERDTRSRPYLEAWVASGRAPGEARLAFLVESEGDAEHLALVAGARVDAWLSTSGERSELPRLARVAAALRGS
jgi:alkanesulfonate monooxygenase SsuD/methylene tetrahydromethanopterin reductase-like flavin-dependent oxidoreductase (luciferase family)